MSAKDIRRACYPCEYAVSSASHKCYCWFYHSGILLHIGFLPIPDFMRFVQFHWGSLISYRTSEVIRQFFWASSLLWYWRRLRYWRNIITSQSNDVWLWHCFVSNMVNFHWDSVFLQRRLQIRRALTADISVGISEWLWMFNPYQMIEKSLFFSIPSVCDAEVRFMPRFSPRLCLSAH